MNLIRGFFLVVGFLFSAVPGVAEESVVQSILFHFADDQAEKLRLRGFLMIGSQSQ